VTQGILSGQGWSIEPQGGPLLEGLSQTDQRSIPATRRSSSRHAGVSSESTPPPRPRTSASLSPWTRLYRGRGHAVRQSRLPGVQVVPMDSAPVAAQLGVGPDVRGAAIAGLLAGLAEEAGLGEGDVIIEVDGGGRER
jgi:hypothetical protein